MLIAFITLALQVAAAVAQPVPKAGAPADANADREASRCVSFAPFPDEKVAPKPAAAPGPPPLLSFRVFEGRLHRRYNDMDLMLDDAGH